MSATGQNSSSSSDEQQPIIKVEDDQPDEKTMSDFLVYIQGEFGQNLTAVCSAVCGAVLWMRSFVRCAVACKLQSAVILR